MPSITTTVLDCGMPLITEKMEGVRSVGLAWLLPGGTARDPRDRQGLSTLLAEVVQRGAGGLDSRAHADACDKFGMSRGVGNEAQFISVTATMLGSRLLDGLPLIVDMVRRPRLDPADFEPARDLAVQAIESLKDDPQERVMHLLRKRHNPDPINRSSLGTIEGLNALTAGDLAPGWARAAVPGGAILGVAGDVDAAALAKRLNELLTGWAGASSPVTWTGEGERGAVHEKDDTNQVHIALCHDAPSEKEPSCWLERAATAVLSGGMSGRLFTEVREKRGLCYSVYASYAADARYGRTVAYSGTTPERAQETLNVLLGELRRVRTEAGAIEDAELKRALVGLKSKLVMSGESSGARAAALVRDYHKIGRARSLDEVAAEFDRVTLDAVNRHLRSTPMGRLTVATIGPAELSVPA